MEENTISVSTFLVVQENDSQDKVLEFKHQFENFNFFDIKEVCTDKNDRWNVFQEIIKIANTAMDDDVIIICFERHRFTSSFSPEKLTKMIFATAEKGGSLLLGGCDFFDNLVPVTEGLYWVNAVNGVDFYVVFRPAFSPILSLKCAEKDDLESTLSKGISNKLMMDEVISERQSNLSDSMKEAGKRETTRTRLAIYNQITRKYQILKDASHR